MSSSATTNPQVQSIRTKLANLARAGGVDYPRIFTLFLLERAAFRLLRDELLSRHLVFKGGFVSVRVYNSPRYTTDLDAVLHGIEKDVASERIKATMIADIGDSCWFELEDVVDLKTQGDYGGTRFIHRAGLGERPTELKTAQLVNVDVGTGDPITPAPIQTMTGLSLGEGNLSWLVYPPETIVAEKLHALTTLGARNSRSKDVFDVGLLLHQTQRNTLKTALKETFAFRGDPIPESIADVIDEFDKSQLRRGWLAAMRSVPDVKGFDETLAGVLVALRHWKI